MKLLVIILVSFSISLNAQIFDNQKLTQDTVSVFHNDSLSNDEQVIVGKWYFGLPEKYTEQVGTENGNISFIVTNRKPYVNYHLYEYSFNSDRTYKMVYTSPLGKQEEVGKWGISGDFILLMINAQNRKEIDWRILETCEVIRIIKIKFLGTKETYKQVLADKYGNRVPKLAFNIHELLETDKIINGEQFYDDFKLDEALPCDLVVSKKPRNFIMPQLDLKKIESQIQILLNDKLTTDTELTLRLWVNCQGDIGQIKAVVRGKITEDLFREISEILKKSHAVAAKRIEFDYEGKETEISIDARVSVSIVYKEGKVTIKYSNTSVNGF